MTQAHPEFPNQIDAPRLDTPLQEGRFLPSNLELKLRKKVCSQIDKMMDIAVNGHGCSDDVYEMLEDVKLMLDLLWEDD